MRNFSHITFWCVVLIFAAWLSGRLSLPVGPLTVDPMVGPNGTNAKHHARYNADVQQEMDRVLTRIENASLHLFRSTEPDNVGPSADSQIAKLESKLGFSVPGQLKAFLKSEITRRIQWSTIWLGWRQNDLAEVAQWSIGEYLSWCNPENGMPERDSREWVPGMVIFMTDDYEFLAVDIETGVLTMIDPESGFHDQAPGLMKWLENIANRLESKQYVSSADEFYLTNSKGKSVESPGEEVLGE